MPYWILILMPWIIQEWEMKALCSLNCHNFRSNKYCGFEGEYEKFYISAFSNTV
jgi:hypothetical protein